MMDLVGRPPPSLAHCTQDVLVLPYRETGRYECNLDRWWPDVTQEYAGLDFANQQDTPNRANQVMCPTCTRAHELRSRASSQRR